MCGRYVLHGPQSRLREHFDLRDCAAWEPRYNIAPQSNILVIRQRPGLGRVGQVVRWGLAPAWFDAWLDPAYRDVAALEQWLQPAPAAGMAARPVSARVGNARNEGPELLDGI